MDISVGSAFVSVPPADLEEMDKVSARGMKVVGESTEERFPAKFCILTTCSRHPFFSG